MDKNITRVNIGETFRHVLPYSEVCMHMKVAGQMRDLLILENGAQILNRDGSHYSFPITHGEAGLYRDKDGLYVNVVYFHAAS